VRTRPNSSRFNTNKVLSINVGCCHIPRFTFHPFHTSPRMTDTEVLLQLKKKSTIDDAGRARLATFEKAIQETAKLLQQ
jgi:hypothetical protein